MQQKTYIRQLSQGEKTMKPVELTNEQLCDMTMDLLIKRLSEESPHLSSPEHGNGVLEIIFGFNSVPRVCDRYSIVKDSEGDLKISFPVRSYDKKMLRSNIRNLYFVVQNYISSRVVPQGKIIVNFKNGRVDDFQINNEGTYRDIERTGKPKISLDDILFGDEEE